jgi:hypothetical protein
VDGSFDSREEPGVLLQKNNTATRSNDESRSKGLSHRLKGVVFAVDKILRDTNIPASSCLYVCQLV